MQIHQNLEQQITEEQNKYISLMLGKDFSALKSIKNNIKKMQRELYTLQKNAGNTSSES